PGKSEHFAAGVHRIAGRTTSRPIIGEGHANRTLYPLGSLEQALFCWKTAPNRSLLSYGTSPVASRFAGCPAARNQKGNRKADRVLFQKSKRGQGTFPHARVPCP